MIPYAVGTILPWILSFPSLIHSRLNWFNPTSFSNSHDFVRLLKRRFLLRFLLMQFYCNNFEYFHFVVNVMLATPTTMKRNSIYLSYIFYCIIIFRIIKRKSLWFSFLYYKCYSDLYIREGEHIKKSIFSIKNITKEKLPDYIDAVQTSIRAPVRFRVKSQTIRKPRRIYLYHH